MWYYFLLPCIHDCGFINHFVLLFHAASGFSLYANSNWIVHQMFRTHYTHTISIVAAGKPACCRQNKTTWCETFGARPPTDRPTDRQPTTYGRVEQTGTATDPRFRYVEYIMFFKLDAVLGTLCYGLKPIYDW